MPRFAALLLLFATGAGADEEDDCLFGEVCLSLEVGESWPVCGRGVLICPALAPICDEPWIAAPDLESDDGLAWKGLTPGTTLCSASSPGYPGGVRTHFRITVR